MDRRRFIKICGTTAALAGLQTTYLETIRAAEMKPFNRVKLMDAQGNPPTRVSTPYFDFQNATLVVPAS